MAELRKDPLSGNWVVVGYGARKKEGTGLCPFCPGNEYLTKPAIREYKDEQGNWLVRCFPAANPIFVIEAEESKRAEGLYDKMGNLGAHEIIVENRSHAKTMSLYTQDEFMLLMDMYRERMADLKKDVRFKYVQIFKNHGELTGSYIFHGHSHVLSTPIIPTRTTREMDNARSHFAQKERCLMCDIVSQEIRQSKRVVAMNKSFVAICPFASRFPFEVWVIPRDHNAHFELSCSDIIKHDLASLLLDLMKRIELVSNAYTIEIHTAAAVPPTSAEDIAVEDYCHWHLEILPRDFRSSKYIREDEFRVVSITPEEAADALKTQRS